MTEHAGGASMSERMAGAGAAQQVEVLERRLAAKQLALAGIQQEIHGIEQNLQRWRAGLAGERQVADVLSGLVAAGWVVLHDLHWPGRPKANLDHVAVGPGGVVVVDTKNWSATAVVGADGVLRAGGYRKAEASADVVRMVADVASGLEPQHRGAVRGALCFTGQDLEPVATADGAVVLGDGQLVDWLSGLPARLQPQEVTAIARYLGEQLGGAVSPGLLTTAALAGQRRPLPPPVHTAKPNGRPSRSTRRPKIQAGKALLKVAIVVTALSTAPVWLEPVGMAFGHLLSGVVIDVLPEAPLVPTPTSAAP
ncbi:NERD domain-containing protein [Quadrisphaera setariae]|uniref:NERD domain-containing protein n=1 Tax=Quadrisphaera setariae TaxID=2593304 RepID=A0A5C8ZDW9_9ACTN|nr:NERD domain-containing protein [Quadrisphaera setariae]TXR55489.1 NERD domain-containing protein [Quadrisphaera setariae]